MKADHWLIQTSKLKLYPYMSIPKDPLTLKRHELDRFNIWADFLAHKYLNMPEENMTLKQREIDVIYSFLQDNKVLLRTLDYSLSPRPYSLEKRRFVRKLFELYRNLNQL